jgi:hypothetical protein
MSERVIIHQVNRRLTGFIVVIAFGSLINNPGSLKDYLTGEWQRGPELPIALARKSGNKPGDNANRRFSRVIHDDASLEATMFRPFKEGTTMQEATNATQAREGTTGENILFLDLTQRENGTFKHNCLNAKVFEILCRWGLENGVAGIVLTGLKSNINFSAEYTRLGLRTGFKNRSNVIVKMCDRDSVLLANTKAYILLIPENMRSALEKRILEGDLQLVRTRVI